MTARFFRQDSGYVLILTLLFMPVFIGIGLFAIDFGRAFNAQADHQAAADALALAGASELDGRDGAIARAQAAMTEIVNTVSFLGLPHEGGAIGLEYSKDASGPFTVVFLRAIPADDDTPITRAWLEQYVAAGDTDARYVYVLSQARDLLAFYPDPSTMERASVAVSARAVARSWTATCDLTPIFMCNPVGGANNGETFKQRVLDGAFHGRMLKLPTQTGNASLTTGNVGFLRTLGNGSEALRRAMAGAPYPECVLVDDKVDTQPGTVNSVWDAYNTRFDIYRDNAGDWSRNGIAPPAQNVRKGYGPPTGNCTSEPVFKDNGNSAPAGVQKTEWYAENPVFSDNREPDTTYDFTGLGDGNSIRKGVWNLNEEVTLVDADGDTVTYPAYWPQLHGNQDGIIDPGETLDEATVTSRPGFPASRYDVYRYELRLELEERLSKGGEAGNEQCYKGTADPGIDTEFDRRTMLVAVVDCSDPARPIRGQETNVPVQFWAEVFLVNPGSKTSMDIEIIDVSGEASNGSVDKFFRTEPVLVR